MHPEGFTKENGTDMWKRLGLLGGRGHFRCHVCKAREAMNRCWINKCIMARRQGEMTRFICLKRVEVRVDGGGGDAKHTPRYTSLFSWKFFQTPPSRLGGIWFLSFSSRIGGGEFGYIPRPPFQLVIYIHVGTETSAEFNCSRRPLTPLTIPSTTMKIMK